MPYSGLWDNRKGSVESLVNEGTLGHLARGQATPWDPAHASGRPHEQQLLPPPLRHPAMGLTQLVLHPFDANQIEPLLSVNTGQSEQGCERTQPTPGPVIPDPSQPDPDSLFVSLFFGGSHLLPLAVSRAYHNLPCPLVSPLLGTSLFNHFP